MNKSLVLFDRFSHNNGKLTNPEGFQFGGVIFRNLKMETLRVRDMDRCQIYCQTTGNSFLISYGLN